MVLVAHHDTQKVVRLEKGKPSERAGRKATGLSPRGYREDTAAGLPSEYSTSCAGFRRHKGIPLEVAL